MHLHRSFGRLWSIAPGISNKNTGPVNPSNGVEVRTNPVVAEMRDRVRLWYLLFICDQYLSILYNRDPLLRSDTEIAISWEAYLQRDVQRDDITDSDVRIVSQVSLLLIMSQIRDTLGSDLEIRVPQILGNQIAYYSRQLDKWFTRFSAMFKPDPYIGDFPLPWPATALPIQQTLPGPPSPQGSARGSYPTTIHDSSQYGARHGDLHLRDDSV